MYFMIDESFVSLESAAVMLNTDIETLLAEILELGIEVEHDPETGLDYINADDLDRVKTTWGITG